MIEDYGFGEGPGFDLDLLLPSFNPRIPPESDQDFEDPHGNWADTSTYGSEE
ncbi:MAG: hypothetical protein QOJ50_1914 [Cryptosporangiaceae bacterium]|nr:hypothetical protein [Cryptosporangiaceae bacterium]